MAIVILIVIAIIVYFAVQKPHDDSQERANRAVAEISKKFGNVQRIEAIEFECDDNSKKLVYAVFEDDGLVDPQKKYEVIETVYASDSDKEKRQKAEYARSVLQKLPYQTNGFSGYAYTWEKFLRLREHGIFLEMREEEKERRKKESEYYYYN